MEKVRVLYVIDCKDGQRQRCTSSDYYFEVVES